MGSEITHRFFEAEDFSRFRERLDEETELLRRMIGRGMLKRERRADDRRNNSLYMTAEGEDVLRRALPAVARAQTRIMEPIPPEQRAAVMDALGLLAGVGPVTRSEDAKDG